MNELLASLRGLFLDFVSQWDKFWFSRLAPHTLAAIRIATGAMLLYTHLVWASDLMAFLGPDAWIPNDVAIQLHSQDHSWSYLWYTDNPALLWAHQGFTVLVMTAFMLGFMTRISVPLAWVLQLMFVHRLTGSLFGLDQMTTMLTMYLALAPCGSVWSIDAVLRHRGKSGWMFPSSAPSIPSNIATRLLQIHVCVIYLFGGVGKMRGEMWWDGTAMWFAVSNYEYQSLDMTWIAAYPVLFAALSHLTVFWETFYCALVWPRFTRPFVIAIAFLVHGGIALSLGMITFGVMMIAANCIFIPPAVFQRIGDMLFRRPAGTPQPAGASSA